MTTWYRALVDHLIGQWEGLRASMARAAGGGGGGACDRDALTRDAACCAEAFSRLARFTRHHEHNQLARAPPSPACLAAHMSATCTAMVFCHEQTLVVL